MKFLKEYKTIITNEQNIRNPKTREYDVQYINIWQIELTNLCFGCLFNGKVDFSFSPCWFYAMHSLYHCPDPSSLASMLLGIMRFLELSFVFICFLLRSGVTMKHVALSRQFTEGIFLEALLVHFSHTKRWHIKEIFIWLKQKIICDVTEILQEKKVLN